jgi:hypothetical protein
MGSIETIEMRKGATVDDVFVVLVFHTGVATKRTK